jgi:hypothetical protein
MDHEGQRHGLPQPALAHVLVAKYSDHLPLYRQSQIFARHGVDIDRSTLANWVGGACWWLEPLQARLAANVFGSTKLFTDDTPIPVLDPSRGRTKIGRLWVYARTIDPGPGPNRRPPSTSTVLIARQSALPLICGTSVVCCKSTALLASNG